MSAIPDQAAFQGHVHMGELGLHAKGVLRVPSQMARASAPPAAMAIIFFGCLSARWLRHRVSHTSEVGAGSMI